MTMIRTRRRKSAASRGYTVLAKAADKPHGLREVDIVDPDGYIWVPGTVRCRNRPGRGGHGTKGCRWRGYAG